MHFGTQLATSHAVVTRCHFAGLVKGVLLRENLRQMQGVLELVAETRAAERGRMKTMLTCNLKCSIATALLNIVSRGTAHIKTTVKLTMAEQAGVVAVVMIEI